MSFSIIARGTPKGAIATLSKQAANNPQVPQEFTDAVNNQLSGLPEDCHVEVNFTGHTGWAEGQTAGQISLRATIDVTTDTAAGEGEASE